MSKWILVAGVLVLILALATGVYQRSLERRAHAQAVGIGGIRPDVASVAGMANGQSVIYLLDVNSGILVAQRIDMANSRIENAGQRNVAADLARIPG